MTRALIAAFALVVASPAHADRVTDAPHGAVKFCMLNPSFCSASKAEAAPVSAMATLVRINQLVNEKIQPLKITTDADKQSENGNWRVLPPGGGGVCVEYALTKETLLAWEGIPAGAMRIAQVRAGRNLHAVLLVTVGKSVLVLDNLTDVIWAADLTQYEWIAVQDARLGWVKPDGAPK